MRKVKKLRQNILKILSKNVQSDGLSMRMHISLYFSIFGGVMLLGVVLSLLLTNNFVPNVRNVVATMEAELNTSTADVSSHFGGIASEVVNLSKSLSADIENRLSSDGIAFSQKNALSSIIPDILDQEIDLLLLFLERVDCSGVFFVLNATVNPDIPDSEKSRAGIYIRRVEPKMVGHPSEFLLLRGNINSAIRRNITLQANWDLEFDISGREFWNKPRMAYAETAAPKLIDVYAWSFESVIPGNVGTSLLCSISMVASDSSEFGVCGFEITETNFRNHGINSSERYNRLSLVFSSMLNGELNVNNALFSGSTQGLSALRAAGGVRLSDLKKGVERVVVGDERYRITYDTASLYPPSSYFSDQTFAVSIVLPEIAYRRIITDDILRSFLIFIGMLLLGVLLFIILSKRLTKPFSSAVEALTIPGELSNGTLRIGIRELDELLRLYSNPNSEQTAHVGELFSEFFSRIESLTPKERAIVACYADGKSQEEILAEMFIALSTLKSHNLHIYAKLGVKSLDELRLYFDLISRSDARDQLNKLRELP